MEPLFSLSAWLAAPEVQAGITVFTFVATIVAFVMNKVRSDIVALCSMAGLLLTGVVSPKEALSGFSNSAVVIMIGLFVVGGAVFQTGLAKTISGRLLRLAGTSEKRLFFLVLLVTALVAAFVSNTGTVALLLPIVLAMSKTAGVNPSKLMMPLAFASSMGGVLTLIGTPPNLIVDGYLRDNGLPGFGFFDFTPIGLVCLAVGLVFLYPLCRFFLKKRGAADERPEREETLGGLLQAYHIGDCVFCLRPQEGHMPVEGRSVGELDIRHRYGVTVLEARRDGHTIFGSPEQHTVHSDTLLKGSETLYVLGRRARRAALARWLHHTLVHDGAHGGADGLECCSRGPAEELITPGSALINRPLRAENFAERFDINVLAIKRGGRYLFEDIIDLKVKAGDMLLVHGAWQGIESMAKKRREWIVIGSPAETAEQVPLSHKAPLTAVIMVLMVLAMVFADYIGVPPVASVIVAGLLMVLTRCVRSVDAAYKMIGWESIVLIAAMMPMSTALTNTGISQWIAETIVTSLQSAGPYAVLAAVYLVTSLLSTFISNSATAILVAPIAWQAAVGLGGVSPEPFMMTAAVAASACFATPICTPPNAMVMNAGHYTFMDYVRVGLPLQIVMGIVAVLVIPLLFPF